MLFTYTDTHPPPPESIAEGLSDTVEEFEKMLNDERFVGILVSTLEAKGKGFTVRDRCHMAALLMVAFQHKGEYSFTVLKVRHCFATST